MNPRIYKHNDIFKTMGASNHVEEIREENDFYATQPKATELLLKLENFSPLIWECACGQGHMSEVLKDQGYRVKSTDVIDRGYGDGIVDFLQCTEHFEGDIITNPPYSLAKEFVYKALELINPGNKLALFLKLTFLESKSRQQLFKKYPPKVIYVASSRLKCVKDGDFEKYEKCATAIAYAWYIWEKRIHR